MSDNEDFIVNSSTSSFTQLLVESQMATASLGTTTLYLERVYLERVYLERSTNLVFRINNVNFFYLMWISRLRILHTLYISNIFPSPTNIFNWKRIQYENKKTLNILLHGGISEESPIFDHNAYFHYPDPPSTGHSFCAQNHQHIIYDTYINRLQ